MATRWIRPRRFVHGDRLVDGCTLRIEAGRIAAVDDAPADRSAKAEALEGTLLPGLLDVQVNGAGGRSVDEAVPEALDTVADAVEAGGAAAFLPTLITAPFDALLEQVEAVARWIEARDLEAAGAVPLGIHAEGPFLEVGGTHATEHFVDPTADRVDALLRAARGRLAMVTLAPGREHAVEATRCLHDAGVCVSFGHARSIDGFGPAVDAGARAVTHLFNAMSPLHHREPGVTGLALDDERLTCALILDGVHLDAVAARVAYRVLGPGRTVLVTDAVAAAGMPDGRYRLAGKPVDLEDGVVRDAEGRLAGSALTMRGAVHGFRSMLRDEDPVHLAQVGAHNAARLLGAHAARFGAIDVGRTARFTRLGDDGTVEIVR